MIKADLDQIESTVKMVSSNIKYLSKMLCKNPKKTKENYELICKQEKLLSVLLQLEYNLNEAIHYGK